MKDERFYKAYMEHRTVSRRGLLRGLFNGVGSAPSIENIADNGIDAATVIRPPGAVTLFDQTCSGCGECVSACGEGVVVMNNHRPELDFLSSYCTRCDACIRSCPTGALQQAQFQINARPALNNPCQNTYMYCDSCADRCQKKAIQWQRNQSPVIELSGCDGCGECAFVCPVNALEMVLA
ncbi:4Fe-4S binding protein [Budvicia diplopodorum]|uniref:4Fe-4S binding protein n=1 Tax=Budvicia diplopodorum TaxID=1119056 RepID=UPI00135C9723|nr:4Fe-4S binding protein [Budvicia diplopodorum]